MKVYQISSTQNLIFLSVVCSFSLSFFWWSLIPLKHADTGEDRPILVEQIYSISLYRTIV